MPDIMLPYTDIQQSYLTYGELIIYVIGQPLDGDGGAYESSSDLRTSESSSRWGNVADRGVDDVWDRAAEGQHARALHAERLLVKLQHLHGAAEGCSNGSLVHGADHRRQVGELEALQMTTSQTTH